MSSAKFASITSSLLARKGEAQPWNTGAAEPEKFSLPHLYPDSRIAEYAAKLHQMVTAFVPKGSTYVFTSFDQRSLKAIKQIDANADIMLIKGGPLTPELMEAARAIASKRIAAKMEGTTRLAVMEAQKQGFIVTGWPGRNLNDYFLGLGLGVDAICSDVPVQVQEFINRTKSG